jgi:hypothetical protein
MLIPDQWLFMQSPVLILEQLLDAKLDGSEELLAGGGALDPPFETGQGLLKGEFAAFKACHRFLQFPQDDFK